MVAFCAYVPSFLVPTYKSVDCLLAGLSSNTAASSMTGHPSLSLPVGFVPPVAEDVKDREDAALKLPVGMMLVGKQWDEGTILKVADAWELSNHWKTVA